MNSHFQTSSSNIELVQMKKKKWQYNKWQHGNCKRKRERQFRHHRDGFWNSSPFWFSVTVPLMAPRYKNAHGVIIGIVPMTRGPIRSWVMTAGVTCAIAPIGTSCPKFSWFGPVFISDLAIEGEAPKGAPLFRPDS